MKMTVGKLIEILSRYNSHLPVVVPGWDHSYTYADCNIHDNLIFEHGEFYEAANEEKTMSAIVIK